MSYATQQDMEDRFGRAELVDLTDRAGTGVVDASVLARAFADADAEIDSYLAGRYVLPLAPVPPLVVAVACDVVRYKLLENRRHEVAEERYKAATRILRDLADGRSQLGATSAEPPPTPGSGPTAVAPGRLFTAQTLEDF